MSLSEVLAGLPRGLSIRLHGDDGFEVLHEGQPMLGIAVDESPEDDEVGCLDYVVGHWPDGEQWVELTRWPVDLDTSDYERGGHLITFGGGLEYSCPGPSGPVLDRCPKCAIDNGKGE